MPHSHRCMGHSEPCSQRKRAWPGRREPGGPRPAESSTSYDPKQGPTHLESECCTATMHGPLRAMLQRGRARPGRREPGGPRTARSSTSYDPKQGPTHLEHEASTATMHGPVRAMLQRGRARPGRREPGAPQTARSSTSYDPIPGPTHLERSHSRASTHGSIRAMLQRGRARPGRREPGGPPDGPGRAPRMTRYQAPRTSREVTAGPRHMGPYEPCCSGGAQGPAAASPGTPQTDRSSTSYDPKQSPTHLESESQHRATSTWVQCEPCCSGGAQGPAAASPGAPRRPGRAPRMTRSRAPRTSR